MLPNQASKEYKDGNYDAEPFYDLNSPMEMNRNQKTNDHQKARPNQRRVKVVVHHESSCACGETPQYGECSSQPFGVRIVLLHWLPLLGLGFGLGVIFMGIFWHR